jgi:hypothetical protein
MEVCCIHTYEKSIMKLIKLSLKMWGEVEGNGNIMKGVTLLKVHCTHV